MEMSNISKIYNWAASNFFKKISTADGDILTKTTKNIDSSSGKNEIIIGFKSGKNISIKEEDIICVSQCDDIIKVDYKDKNTTNTLVLTNSQDILKKENKDSMKGNKEISYKKDLYGQKRKIATIIGENSKVKKYLEEMKDKPLGIVLKNSNNEIDDYLYIPLEKAIENDMNVGTIDCENCEVVNFDVPWDCATKVLAIFDDEDTMFLFPYLKTTFSSMSAILNFSSLNDVLKMSPPEQLRKEQQEISLTNEKDDIETIECRNNLENSSSNCENSLNEIKNEAMNVSDSEEEKKIDVEEDDDDTISDCYRRIAKYMKKSEISGINFWTDKNGSIHCDITLETIFED